MNKLIQSYLRRYGTRDTVLLAWYICTIIALYLYLNHQFRYAEGLGDIRHKAARCWVLWIVCYAFITTFSGYGSLGRSYEALLLPVSANAKFLFTLLRIFVVVPVLSSAILLLIDYGFCHIFAVAPKVTHYASSMWNALTYTGTVYHRLPIMPYYLLTLCAMILVLKTVKQTRLPIGVIFAIIAAFAIVYFGPHYEYGQYNYPFIAGKITVADHGTAVTELVSWTSLTARAQRFVSYIFLLTLPASMLYLSYLRFKELELEQ